MGRPDSKNVKHSPFLAWSSSPLKGYPYTNLPLLPHTTVGLPSTSSIFDRWLPCLPWNLPPIHLDARASFISTPEMGWKCSKSPLNVLHLFLAYPTITLTHLYHTVTFFPSLHPPSLGLNQTTPNPLADRSQLGNMGKKKGNFLSVFEFSVRKNSINRSLHNCMITEVKTLMKTKLYRDQQPQNHDKILKL